MSGWLMGLTLLACSGDKTDDSTETPPVVDTEDTEDTTDVTTGDTGTTSPTGDTAPVEVPFDCSVDQPMPLANWTTLQNFRRAEDFDFTLDGLHISVTSGDLISINPAAPGDGVSLISPNIGGTAGTRVMATGDYIIANVGQGTMIKVDAATGGKETVVTGMSYPNGVEVGRDGFAYVADNNTGDLIQFNPYTLETWRIAENLVQPNGVILSEDEQTIYIGSFGGGKVYKIDRLGATEWGQPVAMVDNPGNDGGFDGINVDICGNVYFTEFGAGKVWRISVNTGQVAMVADLPSAWIPNMRWGNDVANFDDDILYVSDRDGGRLFGLDVGVPGKPHVMAP